jgi:PPM family protein phosphatase
MEMPRNASPYARRQQSVKLAYRARSETGPVRPLNEDCYAVSEGQPDAPPGVLFIVCDSRGGPNIGDVAARLAADTLVATYYAAQELDPQPALHEAFQATNQRIYQQWRQAATWVTAAAALVIDEQMYIASVGDCRVYHFRHGQLRRITADHTVHSELVNQGMLSREDVQKIASFVTRLRALGESVDLEVDMFQETLHENEALLLCTDGLHSYVEDREIEEVLITVPWEEVIDRLIDLVNARNGRDNITAILVWCAE